MRVFAAVGALVCLVGCQSAETLREAAAKIDSPPAPDVREPIVPAGNIALYRNARDVRVGDTWERARDLFPQPTRGAYELRDLPARFKPPYEAHGWETGSGEGYGVIAYNGKVVAAMYQLLHTNETVLNELLNFQRAGTGALVPVYLQGNRSKYWFWQFGKQTLMVSSLSVGSRLNVVIAMGDDTVLQALGISPEAAKHDMATLSVLPEPTAVNGP